MSKKKYIPEVWCWTFRTNSPVKHLFSEIEWGEGKDEREKTAFAIGGALLGLRLEIPLVLALCTRLSNSRAVDIEEIDGMKVTDDMYHTSFNAPKETLSLEIQELKIELLWALKDFCKDRFEFFAGKRTKLLEEADLLNDKVDAFEALHLSLPVFQKELDR